MPSAKACIQRWLSSKDIHSVCLLSMAVLRKGPTTKKISELGPLHTLSLKFILHFI